MKDFSKISKKMKEDWDRRVSHDYRFWMSDGYQDDQAMWSAGERDLRIITRDIGDRSNKTILELGCGVGRLLHAALPDFHKVIGVDVSEKAIQKAGELLAAWSNLELVLCNGSDLHQVATGSVDVTISFAALTSIPTDIIANYLRELHRVLKPDGTLRLQIYLGSHQEVAEGDTLHVRCYPEDNFRRAAEAAGFSIEWSEELILPFQVSFKEVGITAMIVSLKREDRVPAEAKVISEILLPQGEVVEQVELEGSALEYWMALNYAKELVKGGDMGKAEETLRYAVGHSTATAIDVRDLMQRVLSEIEKEGPTKPKPESDKIAGPTRGQGEFFERNWKVLSERFPNTAQVLKLTDARSTKGALEIRSTEQGPVLVQQGQCLDHPTKPTSAAEAWAQKLVADRQIVAAKELAILGLGLGYHIDALLAKTAKPITVIEPSVEAARRALETRDLVSILTRLKAFYIGTDLPQEFSDSDAELVVRPQTQVVAAEFTAKLRTEFLGNRGLSGLSPKIGVLGPIQGGTLPMVPYLANALKSLKQRVRVMDTSDFAGGYAAFDKFVKHKQRRGALENHFIEMMSETVLQSVIEKPVDILITLALAPISGRVLNELRKMGVITVHWFVEDYLRFSYWQQMAQHYDFFFTIQKGDCINKIKAAGAGEVHYLPTACDPMIHAPLQLSEADRKEWGSPISFVGAGYHNRQQMFASMANMPFKIWGTEWPGCKPFDVLVQKDGRRIRTDECVKIFNATEINVNLHSSSERDGVDPYGDFLNPRTFELAAAGAFQLVDERSLLPEAFEIGKEMITFNSANQLKEKINYYSQHPDERRAIAQRARQRVLNEHTYVHRLRQMLATIYSSRYEQLKRSDVGGVWDKFLERSKPYPELHRRCEAAYKRGDEPIIESLISDIVAGEGKLTETEQKLLFLFHIQKQIVEMKREGTGEEEKQDEKTTPPQR